jgi:hypothetical protein
MHVVPINVGIVWKTAIICVTLIVMVLKDKYTIKDLKTGLYFIFNG